MTFSLDLSVGLDPTTHIHIIVFPPPPCFFVLDQWSNASTNYIWSPSPKLCPWEESMYRNVISLPCGKRLLRRFLERSHICLVRWINFLRRFLIQPKQAQFVFTNSCCFHSVFVFSQLDFILSLFFSHEYFWSGEINDEKFLIWSFFFPFPLLLKFKCPICQNKTKEIKWINENICIGTGS